MNKICPLFTKDISSPVTCLNEQCSFYNTETDNCSVNDLSIMYSTMGADGVEEHESVETHYEEPIAYKT